MDGPTAHPLSAPTPLNLFQRLVLQWDKLHPYNAAQILKVAGPADADALVAAWQATLNGLGLGRVHVTDGRSLQHQALNGQLQRYPVHRLAPGSSLTAFISEQLNRPFAAPHEPPFRPFIVDEGDHHYAGIVYHHWVADSVSIRMLLREWFLRLHRPELARQKPFEHPHGGYWSIFGPGRANWGLTDGVLSSVRWSSPNRRVARIEHPGYTDFDCRFALHEVGSGLVAPLLAYARANGATLNDLFLALVFEVCHRFVPLRRTPRRTDLALGTIVDLRPYARKDLSDTFGLFLGFTSTLCRPDDLCDFPRLLRTTAAQSRLHKHTGVPLSSPVRMLAGLAVSRLLPPDKVVEFYRKRVPLAGGISNVNLNRTWAADFHPTPLLDYIRASPTGPLMPLAFTPTPPGDHPHLGPAYRPALTPPDRACQMAQHFTHRLRSLV